MNFMEKIIKNGETYRLGNNTNKTEGSRLDWLDVLRGMAILFVMYGHLYNKQYAFFLFTSPIKIPLFFAISGYLLCGKTESTKVFLRRVCQRVLIPGLILTFVFGLRFILTQGLAFYINYIVGVLTGTRVWYIVCCILAQILFFFLQKFLGSGWKLGVAVLLLVAGGLALNIPETRDLFQIRTTLICQFYLLLGFWIKKYESKLLSMKLWMRLGVMGLYIALAIGSMFLFPGKTLDVHVDKYYNIPYCFLLITVGCVALFVCAQSVKKFPRWLCLIGQNTLIFYIHASLWEGMIERAFSVLRITIPESCYGALILLFFTCIGCGFEAYILNRFFPEANGRKRKKKAVEAI